MLYVRSLVSCENFGALGFWEVLRERKPRKFRSLDGLFTKWCKVRWTVGRPLRLCLEIETEKNKEQKKLKERKTKRRRNWNGEKKKSSKNWNGEKTKSRRNWNGSGAVSVVDLLHRGRFSWGWSKSFTATWNICIFAIFSTDLTPTRSLKHLEETHECFQIISGITYTEPRTPNYLWWFPSIIFHAYMNKKILPLLFVKSKPITNIPIAVSKVDISP